MLMNLLTIEQVLEFINNYFADDRLNVEIPTLYSKEIYEAFWTRDIEEPRWLVGVKGSGNLEQVDTQDLIDFLNKNKLDLVEFQINLLDRILINVGSIAIIVKKARKLLGDSLVDQAIDKIEEFYQTIDMTIEEIMDPNDRESPQKTKLKLIKTQDEEI